MPLDTLEKIRYELAQEISSLNAKLNSKQAVTQLQKQLRFIDKAIEQKREQYGKSKHGIIPAPKNQNSKAIERAREFLLSQNKYLRSNWSSGGRQYKLERIYYACQDKAKEQLKQYNSKAKQPVRWEDLGKTRQETATLKVFTAVVLYSAKNFTESQVDPPYIYSCLSSILQPKEFSKAERLLNSYIQKKTAKPQ